MGGVNVYLKKDLLPLVALPGNYSRRARYKKMRGDDFSPNKHKQLAKWWAADHGIPRRSTVVWEGRHSKDILLNIRWDNSMDSIQSGLYHATHFWKLKRKDGLYNLFAEATEPNQMCYKCGYEMYLEESSPGITKVDCLWWKAAIEATLLEQGFLAGPYFDMRVGMTKTTDDGVNWRWSGNMWDEHYMWRVIDE